MNAIVSKTAELAPWAIWFTILAGVFGTWIRARPLQRRAETEAAKVRAEGDASLRTDLMAMVAKLEAKVEAQDKINAQQRKDCDARVEAIQRDMSAKVSDLEGQVQILRHERNNGAQQFNSLLMLLEHALDRPEKLPAIIAAVKELGEQQAATIALEKGAMKARAA